MWHSLSARLLAGLILIVACAPAGQGPEGPAPPVAESGQPPTPKTLTFGLNGEPKVLGGLIGLGNESNRWGNVQWALHQRLTSYDERGEFRPQLAIEVPSQSNIYPFANAIVEDDLGPLPAHLLRGIYEARDPDRFIQQPFWTREFVGVGPYRLAEWEPGSHMVLKAYDRFAGEGAKIDTTVVRFLPDGPAAVANLLSGAVDGVTGLRLNANHRAPMWNAAEWDIRR